MTLVLSFTVERVEYPPVRAERFCRLYRLLSAPLSCCCGNYWHRHHWAAAVASHLRPQEDTSWLGTVTLFSYKGLSEGQVPELILHTVAVW